MQRANRQRPGMELTTGARIVLKEHPGLNGDPEALSYNIAATSLARRIDSAIRRAVLAERNAIFESCEQVTDDAHAAGQIWRHFQKNAKARDARRKKR